MVGQKREEAGVPHNSRRFASRLTNSNHTNPVLERGDTTVVLFPLLGVWSALGANVETKPARPKPKVPSTPLSIGYAWPILA